MNRVTLQSNDNAAEGVPYMAMELGDKRWKLMFSDAVVCRTPRYYYSNDSEKRPMGL